MWKLRVKEDPGRRRNFVKVKASDGMAAAAEKTTHITRICIEINNRIQKIKEHLVVKSALLRERDVSFFF